MALVRIVCALPIRHNVTNSRPMARILFDAASCRRQGDWYYQVNTIRSAWSLLACESRIVTFKSFFFFCANCATLIFMFIRNEERIWTCQHDLPCRSRHANSFCLIFPKTFFLIFHQRASLIQFLQVPVFYALSCKGDDSSNDQNGAKCLVYHNYRN